jgi:hypothetical protein
MPPSPAKKRRGRESAWDMVRSLGLCLLVVVPIWYLAQPPREAEQSIRVVDQEPEIVAWQAALEGAPVPRGVPEGWLPTVAQGVRSPVGVRLGWNTDGGRYVEFAASTGASGSYVEDLTGARTPEGTVEVDGASWERYVDEDGSVSLVRSDGPLRVVVGTLRSTASEQELLALARSVRPLP